MAVSQDGYERTSFVPKTSQWRDVVSYLRKFATRYTGPIPWLE